MKTSSKILAFLLLCLSTTAAFSQKSSTGKPSFFAEYPNSIAISGTTLQNTFLAIPGDNISISFSDQFVFPGTVLSNETKYNNLQSVIIKSPTFGNALFHLSKITNADNSISYVGRIVNPDAADGYEIKKDNNNNYRFQKIETGRILQDCSY